MSAGEQASFPIEHWEGAGKYIADELNKAMKKAGSNSDQDSKDLEDSELMKHWHERNGSGGKGALVGGAVAGLPGAAVGYLVDRHGSTGGDFKARKFDASKDNDAWTTTEDCSFEELPGKWAQYLLDLRNYQTKCWNELVDCWNANYLYQLNSPRTLWDKAELWKSVKTKEMDNLVTDIGKMQLQTSWVGAGATAYGKAIGVQTEAFAKITELVQASGGALNDGSTGLQRFYLSVAQCAIQMQTELETNQPPTKEDMGYRTRVAISVFKNCKDYFENELEQGIRTWSTQVDDGVKKLKDAIANERPFTGQQWPKVGDLSDMEPGPTNPMGMPPTTPGSYPNTSMPDVDTDMPVTPDGYDPTDMDNAGYGESKL